MRVRMLTLYGALEILVGVVAITSSTSHEIGQSAQSEKSIALIVAVLGGVYKVIRGLDNVLAYYMQLAPAVRFPAGVKQSKSRQILANAEANPSNPVVMISMANLKGPAAA